MLDFFQSVCGAQNILINQQDKEAFLWDSRHKYQGNCDAVVLVENTEQVQKIVRYCNENNIVITPQGGNTGRCAGATPMNITRKNILINCQKMQKIGEIDIDNSSIMVDSGVILANLCEFVQKYDKYFPLSLGSWGSCQIGGNIATNAGGHNTIKYGNMRDLVLGVEAVLPNGAIFSDLNNLRKNNTGYDIKQLLIGSEGTLGIITKAVLKLVPKPQSHQTMMLALNDSSQILPLFQAMQARFADSLSAFELMPKIALEMLRKHYPQMRQPWQTPPLFSILCECESPKTNYPDELSDLLAKNLFQDAIIAQSSKDREEFWHWRELIVAAQAQEGASIKHDIALPISKIPEFMAIADKILNDYMPEIRPYCFGHVGDGNLHYNISAPPQMQGDEFYRHEEKIHQLIHDLTMQMGGSFSAEHGIGRIKNQEMRQYKSPIQLLLMREIKHLFDKNNIMNPDVII